ncbi:RNA polymerase sigma24 factor [Planotetraspora thailandica]|uniref:RNA polymerase sigma24 factor n=1 Tax=Planotetraspora thailandica TaxID=487172 RepID=A0A8J3V5R0_9ACTN|nr:RNA polymerase sigma factor [Planotetraspora thailandica]GII56067.1 RNA polymerase sigma24 factor [Planotetraspora thailandica]
MWGRDQAERLKDRAPRKDPDGEGEPSEPATITSAASTVDLTTSLERARQGDERAFEVLYLDIQPRLLRYLRTLVDTDAEDVAAEAWLLIATALPTFTGDSSAFRGWTATIARNRAIDHLRQRKRRPVSTFQLDALNDIAGHDGDPERLILDKDATDEALTLIGRLPREQADAVLLRFIVGLNPEETGKVLGKRAGAIRTATYRGLRNLAAQLKPSHGATQHSTRHNEDRHGQRAS